MRQKYFFLIIFLAASLRAQDERFFRRAFTGDLIFKDKASTKEEVYHWKQNSSIYEIDLDGDGLSEGIVAQKQDGADWFNIYNAFGKKVYSYKLEQYGIGAVLYKVGVRKLSERTKLLLLYFYEGQISYLNYHGTARLYFLTMEDSNLKSLTMFPGPRFWEERELKNGHYHRRAMKISLYDYNGDGTKEVAIKHANVSRIFFYQGGGSWKEL